MTEQQLRLEDLDAGRLGRDRAVAILELTTVEWLEIARNVAERVARARGRVTADDVRRECPIPEGRDPRLVGAVFKDRRFRKAGMTQTARAEAHARPIAVFELVS